LSNNKAVFLNADDPIQLEKLKGHIKKFGFSTENRQYYKIEFVSADPFVKIKVEDTTIASHLIGSYNFTNCAAAILMGRYFNVPLQDIKIAVEEYIPKNNRSQILEKNGHTIILDAYNANPTSMKAALENFDTMQGSTKIAFLGDMFELGKTAAVEHKTIADLAEQMNFDDVYLIGENFNAVNTPLKTFESYEAVETFLKKNKLPHNSDLLIKGSRGMALERLLNLI